MFLKIFLFCFMCLFAQAKEAVVNLAVIESKLVRIKDVHLYITKHEENAKKDLDEKKAKLEKRALQIQQSKQTISQESLSSEIKKIEDDYKNLQKKAMTETERFEYIRSKFLRKIESEVQNAVVKIAKTQDIDKVFNLNTLLYFNSKNIEDISESVLQDSEKLLKNINVDKLYKEFNSEYEANRSK